MLGSYQGIASAMPQSPQKTAGLQALRKMLFTQGTSNPAAEAELIFSDLRYA